MVVAPNAARIGVAVRSSCVTMKRILKGLKILVPRERVHLRGLRDDLRKEKGKSEPDLVRIRELNAEIAASQARATHMQDQINTLQDVISENCPL